MVESSGYWKQTHHGRQFQILNLQSLYDWMSSLPVYENRFSHTMVESSEYGTFDCGETEYHYYQFTNIDLVALGLKVPHMELSTFIRLNVYR